MRWLPGFVVAVLVVVLLAPSAAVRGATAYAHPTFQTQWNAGERAAPDFWGPLSTAREGQQEPYREATGGQRLVQYFDKARMEYTNGRLTNGLLTTELKTGRMQVGDGIFETRAPARVNIAGDPGTNGPTYADLAKLREYVPDPRGGVGIPFSVFRAGEFVSLPFDAPGAEAAGFGDRAPGTPIATYMGDPNQRYGAFVYRHFYDFIAQLPGGVASVGYPISQYFIAEVRIGGTPTRVLVQPFERRVLTYNLNNPPTSRVEFGNIGQHYYQWRYGGGATAPVASQTAAFAPARGSSPVASAVMPTVLFPQISSIAARTDFLAFSERLEHH